MNKTYNHVINVDKKDMSGEVWEDSDMLDLQACKDLVLSDLHTTQCQNFRQF